MERLERFLKKFELAMPAESCEKYYAQATRERDLYGAEIMNFEKYDIFTYMKEDLARIRDELAKDPDAVLYCYFAAEILREEDKPLVKNIGSPKKAQKSELYDTLPLFALLYLVSDMTAEHKKRGIPADVTKATCDMFENQVRDFIDLNHRYGISDYVSWMLCFVKCRIIRVGRFNFEIAKYGLKYDVFEKDGRLAVFPKGVEFHRSGRPLGSVGCEDDEGKFFGDIVETDEYYEGLKIEKGLCFNEKIRLYKNEWKKVLTQGDTVVGVHIPSGGSMPPEVCDRDIARGREIIWKSFGKPKAFFCSSWLLDPQIESISGKPGNISKFGDRFERFPRKDGGSAAFEYIFMVSPDTPLELLPEKTSFASKVKRFLLDGGHIYNTDGVFL